MTARRLSISHVPGFWTFSMPLMFVLAVQVGPVALGAAEKKKEKKQEVTKVENLPPAPDETPKLTPEEVSEGWIMLFDGATPFGWDIKSAATIGLGKMELKGPGTISTTTNFGDFELKMQVLAVKGKEAELVLNGEPYKIAAKKKLTQLDWRVETKGGRHAVKTGKLFGGSSTHNGASHTPITISLPEGTEIEIHAINLRPLNLKSMFNGKDLTGWKPLAGHKSVFSVTRNGEINVKNGNGDLQSEGQWKDFMLQLEVISNGDHLNSGIFFRSIPDQFWEGYEAQIRNEWQGSSKNAEINAKPQDRTKPVDIGTGGIYNRQPSRKVVSNDHEWFTYTITADGPHVATWVNGYQTADYVDNEPDGPNARDGHRYLGKGVITIQGHDPTTDLSFKNIRIAELPETPGTKDEKKEK